MKKSRLLGAVCACVFCIATMPSYAALIERLGGLAYYDSVAGLTWLADANAAGTTMNWTDANNWAAGLTIDGVGGWRLANTLQPDASCDAQNGGDSAGFNCTGSEMGNLFYNVLGGSAGSSIITTHNANYDLFSNVQGELYWSATGYQSSFAWYFNMSTGGQNYFPKASNYYAWAVHTGDVAALATPVPAAVWLFGSGLIGLIGVARRKAA